MKNLPLISSIALFFSILFVSLTPPRINSWEITTEIELEDDGSINSIVWLPNGDEVIISTSYGELSRYDVRNKRRVWTKTVTNHSQSIFVSDINSSGTEMITYGNEVSTESEINLVIRSTSDGSIVRSISEESDYVEKKYANNEPLDLRRTNDPENLSWQMIPAYAKYDNNGGMICVWKNGRVDYSMFDHSLVAYNSNYDKIMEWQQISMNNHGGRNGNMSGHPTPVMVRIDANNFIYGDADCDLYVLDQATIDQGKKNFEIEDKKTGPKIFSRPFEEDVAVTGLELRGNQLHVMIAGSGYAHYRIYDASTRKPISSSWLELGNEDYYMQVSSSGKYFAVGRNGFRIYNTSTLQQEYDSEFAGGYAYTFNPTNDDEMAVFKSGKIVLMKRR